MSVHDTEALRIHKTDHDPVGGKQLRDVRKQSLVQHLRLFGPSAQPVERDALPRGHELREPVHLVAHRDAGLGIEPARRHRRIGERS